jgi:hypothetical protein
MTQPKPKPGDKPDDQHEEIDLNKAENNALDAAWSALENDPEFQKALAASTKPKPKPKTPPPSPKS